MAIAVSTSIVGLSVMGWRSVGGQLLASAVLMLSGHQDVGLRARFGAAFWFFVAIAFCISALVTAILVNLPYAVAICALILCCETLLIRRAFPRKPSA